MKILNFGSLNLDFVYTVDHIVHPGETIISKGMERFCGGKGLNQSIALAKAGADVWHAGLIGLDGSVLKETMEQYGVHAEWVEQCEGTNGHALIQVDQSGQNSIVVYGGSNQMITTAYIETILSRFMPGDILLLQNELNCTCEIMEKAHKAGLKIALNPSPVSRELIEGPLEMADWLILNEIEGAQICGLPEDTQANCVLSSLHRRFPKCALVLTLGKNGGVYQDQNCMEKWDIWPVKAVDTTAAGDTFTGYFLAGVANGAPVKQVLQFASAASALAVGRKGASASIPYRNEVMDFVMKMQ